MTIKKSVFAVAIVALATAITSNILTPLTEVSNVIVNTDNTVEQAPSTLYLSESVPSHKTHRAGQTINIIIPGKLSVTGNINLVQEDAGGIVRIGGSFNEGTSNEGTFAYAYTDKTVTGVVMMGDEVYELPETSSQKFTSYINKHIDTFMCVRHPGEDIVSEGAEVTTGTVTTGTVNTSNIPLLASKPTAKCHLYLEFNGATVIDPLWNGGRVIVAKSPGYNEEQIKVIWSIVSERYAAFNINVTTDVAYYNKAKPTWRQRAILTPSNTWMPGWGGYAFIGSNRLAGMGIYSPTIPCFIFTNMFGVGSTAIRNVGECVAHELGHTLGLTHDGTSSSAYYYGQGQWAPIMGAAYSKAVVQFSRGEYSKANNKQDDLSVITTTNKDVTYTTTPQYAPSLLSINDINLSTTISNQSDYRYYRIRVTTPGILSITAAPGLYSGVDLRVDIINSSTSFILTTSDTAVSQKTTATSPILLPGIYDIKIYGAGEGNALTTGYTKYGSIGTVLVTGTFVSTAGGASARK